ncbi:MAG: hypothetical protein AAB726_00745 [Patescibacteria group bacterium]
MQARTAIEPVMKFVIMQTGGKTTANCFVGDRLFSHRDPSLDNRLPKIQELGLRGLCSVLHVQGREDFFSVLAKMTGADSKPESISDHLMHYYRVWTLPQIEDVVGRHNGEPCEDIGLVSKLANFFPVVDVRGVVSLVHLSRPFSLIKQKWGARVVRLDLTDIAHPGDEMRIFLREP